MKLLAPIILTLSAIAMAASNDDSKNIKVCKETNVDIVHAIDHFCNGLPRGQELMVPSDYTSNGATVGKAHVFIKGSCKPAQWLPRHYCYKQFWSICGADMGAGGFGRTDEGRNHCQKFIIQKLR